jgi:hypothetical protein
VLILSLSMYMLKMACFFLNRLFVVRGVDTAVENAKNLIFKLSFLTVPI